VVEDFLNAVLESERHHPAASFTHERGPLVVDSIDPRITSPPNLKITLEKTFTQFSQPPFIKGECVTMKKEIADAVFFDAQLDFVENIARGAMTNFVVVERSRGAVDALRRAAALRIDCGNHAIVFGAAVESVVNKIVGRKRQSIEVLKEGPGGVVLGLSVFISPNEA
jgi:hypothetical protein